MEERGHSYFWTKAEDRLLAKAVKEGWQHTTGRELARQLGRSVVAIENRRRYKFGRVQPTPRPWKRSEERYLGHANGRRGRPAHRPSPACRG